MTDTQLITLAIAIIFPLSMLLYSNSRISEAKETLRAEIKAEAATQRAETAAFREDSTGKFAEVRMALLRIENKLDHVIETQADHGSRLEKLEGKK